MSEIINVKLSGIDSNPLRQLADYPYNEDKIETLRRSIQDVGLWEGVIARKTGGRYQIAFGHHRVEAARQELGKEARIPLVIRELTDKQMLEFMGRENLEDYNADFLVMLESWQAGIKYLGDHAPQNPEDIEIARLLGWLEARSGERKGEHRSNHTARACSDAAKLIAGGYMKRDTLAGLSVKAVRELCARVVAQHEMLEKMAKQTQRPKQEIESAKRASGRAAGRVAKDIRAGRTAQRDIRGSVDAEAYQQTKDAKRRTPLFAMFGKSLAESISHIAKDDALGKKLSEIKQALSKLTEDSDVEVVKRIALECESASERFDKWSVAFANPKTKVVKLKEVR